MCSLIDFHFSLSMRFVAPELPASSMIVSQPDFRSSATCAFRPNSCLLVDSRAYPQMVMMQSPVSRCVQNRNLSGSYVEYRNSNNSTHHIQPTTFDPHRVKTLSDTKVPAPR